MEPNEAGPSREERISRMEAEGVLSPAQAEMLRQSLSVASGPQASSDERGPSTGRMAVAKWVLYLALVLLAVLSVGLLEGGGGGIQEVSQTINQPGVTGEMNKSLSNLLAIMLILAVPVAIWAWLHNSLVSREEAVFASWAQVESSYQRRSDLIPSLVETVSRYLRHEAATLAQVTRERGAGERDLAAAVEELIKAQKASADLLRQGGKMLDDPEALAAIGRAELQVGGQMQRMFALAESYPELKSADQFLTLQGQLEGTENRINVARMRFNEAVEAYNQSIRKLPGSLVAGVGRFSRKAYFQADEEAENAPKLDFH